MAKLDGKRAFITGAGGGIGAAIARVFAEEGANVGLADINGPLVEKTAAEIAGARAYVVDVRDRSALHAAVDDFAADGLDIFVNNAVAFYYAPLTEMPEDITHRMLDVGIKGTFWGTQAATPHLVRRGGGSIINMSSVAVSFAIKHAAVYTAIKGAVDAFTRQQAVELGAHGIRVNALAPGAVETPGASSVIDAEGWEKRRAMTPLGRLVTDREVAAAAVFLASEEGVSIAGVTLKIDAGITIAGPR
ncbi:MULTISPECIES: SDR family oxidoreductase [unclassified Chelatococcus]|uniref:SDR family NAD(P)-dependent oxidoreductase n=1 Tax=unclassified Chelatococcus TaxID=2638111 RepID=UPI001BCD5B71|nr:MULTISPECIES: SDR family oxidoreductase [unclassified Chelatococcus]MBS7699993.1 SDR family oxidoreductase [Chelatococcus sp. YT9]MBX3558582.1 SDR family oxidoreductase [Chelatococcus sp.]